MKTRKFFILVIVVVAFIATSCVGTKQVLYLQDMNEKTQIELENKFEAVVSPYDELAIHVSCYEEELARPFNIMGGYGGSSSMGSTGGMGYLVDVNGNIQFPILGELHVAGMTRLQIQTMIEEMLRGGNYINEPFVYVRFQNYKIFFLGAQGGKSITIPNERCTFLEALALSGDLDTYTRRDKIGILREEDGKMIIHYLDPRSSDIFNDPYFLLRQNDFIITESIHSKYTRENISYWLSWWSVVTSLVSIVTFIMTIQLLNKK